MKINIGPYQIRIIVTKHSVNEREIVRLVNRVIPRQARGIHNHIERIKTIRRHPELWYGLESGEQVSLQDAKHFADTHWEH